MTKYYEDLEVGSVDRFGNRTITKEEIIQFAKKFDPQPFHVNEEAAKESIFGGIIASGLHTMCLSVRIYTDEFLYDVPLVAGKGLDKVRFQSPVYPEDILSIKVEVLDKEDSTRKQSWGNVRFKLSTLNQNKDIVLSLIDLSIVERK